MQYLYHQLQICMQFILLYCMYQEIKGKNLHVPLQSFVSDELLRPSHIASHPSSLLGFLVPELKIRQSIKLQSCD